VELGDVLDDREPEPEAAVGAGARAVRLTEALEDVIDEGGLDALPAVAHGDLDGRGDARQPDLDAPATRSELHGVREEVPDHLLEARGVSDHVARAGIQDRRDAYVLRVRRGAHDVDRGLDHAHELHGHDVEPHLAGDDPRDVEEVLDELRLHGRVALDGLERLRPARFGDGVAAEEASPPEHRVERRAQLVGDGGEELVHRAIRALGDLMRDARSGSNLMTVAPAAARARSASVASRSSGCTKAWMGRE